MKSDVLSPEPPAPDEIPLKQWAAEQARVHRVTPQAIYHRLLRRKDYYYPNLRVRRVNQRVVYVSHPS